MSSCVALIVINDYYQRVRPYTSLIQLPILSGYLFLLGPGDKAVLLKYLMGNMHVLVDVNLENSGRKRCLRGKIAKPRLDLEGKERKWSSSYCSRSILYYQFSLSWYRQALDIYFIGLFSFLKGQIPVSQLLLQSNAGNIGDVSKKYVVTLSHKIDYTYILRVSNWFSLLITYTIHEEQCEERGFRWGVQQAK